MSTSRAKRKRRQRERAAATARADADARREGATADPPRRAVGAGSAGAGASGAGAGSATTGDAPRPSRFEVRDGVARPKPVWAPFPLTEIGMAAGIALFATGFFTQSAWTLTIGALVLAVVTADLCLREHFAGFRSHTLLLAALPVAIGHGLVVFAISDGYRGPAALAVDLAIGGALAWLLRARFRAAHEHARAAIAGEGW